MSLLFSRFIFTQVSYLLNSALVDNGDILKGKIVRFIQYSIKTLFDDLLFRLKYPGIKLYYKLRVIHEKSFFRVFVFLLASIT